MHLCCIAACLSVALLKMQMIVQTQQRTLPRWQRWVALRDHPAHALMLTTPISPYDVVDSMKSSHQPKTRRCAPRMVRNLVRNFGMICQHTRGEQANVRRAGVCITRLSDLSIAVTVTQRTQLQTAVRRAALCCTEACMRRQTGDLQPP